MNATTYKNGMNEGGEGYNPFVKNEVVYNRNLYMGRLLDKMNAMNNSDPDHAELKAEYDALQAEIDAEWLAEWTIEVTMERKTIWNAWASKQTKINGVMVAEQERKVGFSFDSLKKAAALYK